ncbi:hypothetical protein RB195_009043 [Necator americanus]|uniref:Peptidase S1 domain-containing protein n=1 Tax=Necator americanus TaxID=51031 RepID=A0ABR1CU28_NECAM
MRFLLCILFSAFLITTVQSLIAQVVYDPITCGLPGRGFKGKLRTEKRKVVGNDVNKIVKRDIDKDYSADYSPTAGDETEEDENDPMRTKVMGGERAAKDELPWAAIILFRANISCGATLISRRHVITAAHCFVKNPNGTVSLKNMRSEEDVLADIIVGVGGTCLKPDKKYKCGEEDNILGIRAKRISYRSYFEYGSDFTHDFAILELTRDVPEHIHHICLPHMNKKIDIGDPSLRMSSFGWGQDAITNLSSVPFLKKVMLGVKMTEKECKKIFPEKLDDTFCTVERKDSGPCEGDSGTGITAKIGIKTYLLGVLTYGTDCKKLVSGGGKPEAQLSTDVTKYAALIDSWLGAKKPK